MADKENTLKVIHGRRNACEVQKADAILKALLVDKDRDTAFQIAETLTPRGGLTLVSNTSQR